MLNALPISLLVALAYLALSGLSASCRPGRIVAPTHIPAE